MSHERWCKRCGRQTCSPMSPYCAQHRPSPEERARWANRPRKAHAYGAAHRLARKKYEALVEAGSAWCARCGQRIPPGARFDLDHDDSGAGYVGVSHPRCNRRHGGRLGAQVTNGKRAPAEVRRSREW
jgi:hypothetical protein